MKTKKLRKKNKIDISSITSKYQVRKILEKDIPKVYDLCKSNLLYYEYLKDELTFESIKEDLKALPVGKTSKDKFYIGFFENKNLVAVMDFVLDYPKVKEIWIGFFMMEKNLQNLGIGSRIIEEFLKFAKENEFEKIGLAYIKGNIEGENFWIKNKFSKLEKEIEKEKFVVIKMEKIL